MSEKNKPVNTKKHAEEKIEQHKKSTDTSKVKERASKDPDKKVEKTGTKYDDWNDPTGNTHLGDKS
jgi:hypothetical protein